MKQNYGCDCAAPSTMQNMQEQSTLAFVALMPDGMPRACRGYGFIGSQINLSWNLMDPLQ